MNGEREAAKVSLVKFCQRWETMNLHQRKKADSILRRQTREQQKFIELIEPRPLEPKK